MLLTASVIVMLAGMAQERPVTVVEAPNTPVRLEHATVVSATEGPPVLLYAATNLTGDVLDQFTVMAFIFRADGTLKATQLAPGRRTLEGHETKYSTMVIDGVSLDPGDSIVVGVNQAQRENSEAWWRADLQAAAEARARKKP